MRRYLAPITIGATLAGLLFAMAQPGAEPTAASRSELSVVVPETYRGDLNISTPPTLLQTSADGQFAAHEGPLPVRAPDRRPVAQLPKPPAALEGQVLALFSPQGPPLAAEDVAYDMLATVDYQGSARLIITTSLPSAAAAKHPILLGHKTLQFGNGRMAWQITAEYNPDLPNQIAWTEGQLIVTAASNLPLKELLELAEAVEVVQ
ncbi:MAG TPA: hypothetical protein VGE07_04435 [Herpetosiphonaceae bacterium]